ncbi:MAG: hypothetical protein HOQ03_11345 [Thermoleophilia bacterium]|nr:hypothetical protein [Thermoleophilia bacterium]
MEGSRRSRISLVVAAALIAASLLFAQTSASDDGPTCQFGAISALGPVDAQGNGDTTPDVRCIEP